MVSMSINGKSILVTGGTGSFGTAFTKHILAHYSPARVIVFSRDELKQYEMQQSLRDERLRFFLGDVRDESRLRMALDGVHTVVHAAALKQVPAAEYNPFECIKTNVLGAQNIIEASLSAGVEKICALSTDKAANPINLYGATKLCSDKLFVAANSYGVSRGLKSSVVRYGNVVGSRGSIVPFLRSIRHTGRVPVTDRRMTRFWITIEQGVQFVLDALERMHGGELFVPKIPSADIMTVVQAVAPGCEIDDIGIRPGEKLHELMISTDDARRTRDMGSHYQIEPEFPWWNGHRNVGTPVPEGFSYASDNNPEKLSVVQVRALLESIGLG
jgi:UDP-N-acetylglucosamine 4,6-dehydratase